MSYDIKSNIKLFTYQVLTLLSRLIKYYGLVAIFFFFY